jgi:MFS family permease
MDWVCDNEWKGSFSQSLFFARATVGTLIFGWISDHYGRFKVRSAKPTLHT